jgi:hypothetical protein
MPTNSRSATFFGNVYLFTGWWGVACAAAAITLAFGVALRRESLWGWLLAGLIDLTLMSFSATYPNGIAALLQGAVSMGALYLLLRWRPWPHKGPRTVATAAARTVHHRRRVRYPRLGLTQDGAGQSPRRW